MQVVTTLFLFGWGKGNDELLSDTATIKLFNETRVLLHQEGFDAFALPDFRSFSDFMEGNRAELGECVLIIGRGMSPESTEQIDKFLSAQGLDIPKYDLRTEHAEGELTPTVLAEGVVRKFGTRFGGKVESEN